MVKEERNKITINKDLFAFTSTFNDVYFANDLNWKKIAIHFKHSTSNQRKIIVLREDANEGWFELSALARTGLWQIDKIQVFDKDGDMTYVPRSGMPSPTSFDISAVTKIAPSEPIVSFQDASNVILGINKGSLYEINFRVRIYDDTANAYLNPVVYVVSGITENVLTLDQAVTNYAGKTLRLKFANYSDCSPRQKSIYGFAEITYGAP